MSTRFETSTYRYSVASIPSGIIASLLVVVGALLSYDDSTVQRGSMWHSLLLVIVVGNVVFMAYPLVQQERHVWNVLQVLPAFIGALLLGGLVVLGALLAYDATREAHGWTARVLLLVMVPLSVFLIAHPLADRANGVPQSFLPVPAGVLLLVLALWKLAVFPRMHETPRD